ncbi:MAG TPA: hypothetical protein VGI87_16585 [Solirubrobacteraceae bacterium]|jgi:hypothetical protein
MTRSLVLRLALAACGLVLLPASASASIVELGATKTAVAVPTCPPNTTPSQCTIILTRATALETIRDNIAYPTTVKKAGSIVAFTVGLADLSSDRGTRLSDLKFLDSRYGGTTQLAVTVLRPVGPKKQRVWKVMAESPLFHVQPYLGEVVQFPLATTLPVAAGDTVALTTPTWAPVLSIDLPSKSYAYRQSRKANCSNPPSTSQAQMTVGATSHYTCDYPGTRVEYTATEVTTPPIPKNYVHGKRKVHRPRVLVGRKKS